MDEKKIEARKRAALVNDIKSLQASIRRRLRPFWPELPPLIVSLVGAGLADLVRDPHIQYFPIEVHGAPPVDAHHVMELQGLKALLPAELRRLRDIVARYGVPELTFALLTDPEALRAAESQLAEG